ncbi:N-acetylmuramoyl-L-alanine amidase [Streptomyces sp. NPDC052811]|uniref:N-acetylmuramoyl-L-alanine amidase n=1 Tax=Streptomyces sp. NPDC052811 TaxID=3155731 RepID=UPI003422D5FE
MSRRQQRDAKKRLFAYGVAGAVVATALGTVAVAAPGAVAAPADGRGPGAAGSLQSQFTDAAKEFKVPQSVLMAVSYRQTLWEDHDGRPSTSGAYNVMGLTRVTPADLERPSDQERLAHLDMSGDPSVMKKFDAKKALATAAPGVDTNDPRLHTLDTAAALIGKPMAAVRDDAGQSIRAGAALLAQYQRAATGSLPGDAGAWYPAVARYSQASDAKGADLFAQRVFDSVRSGESRVTTDGQRLTLPADGAVKPVKTVTASKAPLAATSSKAAADAVAPECPAGLACDFKPADPNNYNVATRPDNGFDIRQIVIHDTETDYQTAVNTFQNPTSSASAHYIVKDDGSLVTQLVATKDESYHAGNKTMNMHALGVEHVGFAMKAGSWYGEPLYDSSATLVKYLAGRFNIPLDREHIIGHDEVPGPLDGYVAGQHWDPGPFWDWNHYMSLLGAPTGAGGAGQPLAAGQVVKVVPPFSAQTTTYLDPITKVRSTFNEPVNFGFLYTTPSTTGDPLTDPYLGTQVATEGPNWANKVVAGGSYVVADWQGDWTAIWYGGQKAWFYNPGGQYTAVVDPSAPVVLKAKGTAAVAVYGRSYPEDAAYAGTGVPVQGNNSASLTKYTIPADQAYVAAGAPVAGDYYYGGTTLGTLVKGTQTFYPIRYNHRIAWVRTADVQQVTPAGPIRADNRYDLLARDANGGLWQYQGSGDITQPFLTRFKIGSGWGVYNAMTDLSDFRADGRGDLIARDTSGVAWYYKGSGNPAAPFGDRVKLGAGWGAFNALVGAGDLTGDGQADLIARDGDGKLWFYPGTGGPAFGQRTQIGSSWQIYDAILSTGDLDGDGKGDFVAREPSGKLWFYPGTGSSIQPFGDRHQIGSGWNIYNAIVSSGDLNGDGKPDLTGRDADGKLWFYPGNGGTVQPFGDRRQIGSGWNIYNTLL